MKKNTNNKKDTAMVFTITVASIIACIMLDISLFYGFLIAILFSYNLFRKRGFSSITLTNMMKSGLWECRMLYVLIMLIGATMSIWLSSGTVPAMIYYGLDYMKGVNFLFAAFVITSIISVFMGTAVGTISTIGLALLGIGKGFEIPTHVLLGVLISGAFIADKISPISGLLNLTLTTTDTKYRDAVKKMMVTFIPVYIITAAAYYILGTGYDSAVESSNLQVFQQAIREGFYISPYLLLLPAIVLVLSFSGVDTIKAISTGLAGGILASLFLQDMGISEIIKSVFFGYRGTTPTAELNDILVSGGIASMIEVILIVMGAIALSSLFEGTGIIKPVIDNVMHNVKTPGKLIIKTGIISGMLTVITCDQTVGIVIPGRLLKDRYEKLHVDKTILVRTISDTGTIIAPLMPWNVNGLIIFIVTGATVLYSAPYAVLCYMSPIVTFVVSKFVRSSPLQFYKDITTS
ncbi:transporter, NhaC family (TC 2.A.35) [Dethiosulfatibacter aminovorans DSM 17477]|uniref:Transporter, NhaC family (TC 2.A.35) n=1 Tax=Dethiosulfatibacter aminovorans DSM 17477 TaxID=1121476 RepID=A0A1M6JWI0_9FIRM|nr:Na+/H+ antiporter NhaC family protein [Dethiosulfatibacter aminovorans]SHJ51013.1 transporter, NhaC family (TC 2.A.35) [Dethiosulfatibacter aminovorans DSM 17477]